MFCRVVWIVPLGVLLAVTSDRDTDGYVYQEESRVEGRRSPLSALVEIYIDALILSESFKTNPNSVKDL